VATIAKALTYEEWLEMPEVQDGIEDVVKGEVRVMPPNKTIHGDVAEGLYDILKLQLDPKTKRVRISSFGLVIRRDPLTTREPNLAVFEKAKMVEIDGYFHSAPGLLVEVLSPGNTRVERDEKIRDFESLGVPELWVISTRKRTVEIMQLSATGKLETVARCRPRSHPA
jgi:Uma2 family endonuclease